MENITVPDWYKVYTPKVCLRTVQDYVKKFNMVLERDGIISVTGRDKKRIQVRVKKQVVLLKTINEYYKDKR